MFPMARVYCGMSDFGQNPAPEDLQFQHAEPLPDQTANPNVRRCVVCKTLIGLTYFHAQGQVVCPMCAERIQSGQQKPPAISLARAALYGAGGALAGCVLWAAVEMLLHVRIGIVAIAVGILVGKAVRAGSRGLGGRPQQILAVLLTYFAITTSYMFVYLHAVATNPQVPEHLIALLVVFAAAPFFGLTTGIGGWISLFIIFIGLQQAWRLTARSEILVTGPFETTPAE